MPAQLSVTVQLGPCGVCKQDSTKATHPWRSRVWDHPGWCDWAQKAKALRRVGWGPGSGGVRCSAFLAAAVPAGRPRAPPEGYEGQAAGKLQPASKQATECGKEVNMVPRRDQQAGRQTPSRAAEGPCGNGMAAGAPMTRPPPERPEGPLTRGARDHGAVVRERVSAGSASMFHPVSSPQPRSSRDQPHSHMQSKAEQG